MKNRNLYSVLILVLILAISGCTIDLPDLNPNTEEGAEISIFDIADPIAFNGADSYTELEFPGYYREYDIWDDGSIDLKVEHDPAAEIVFNFPGGNIEVAHEAWETLPVAGYYTPLYLPVDGLTGGTINGEWSSGVRDHLLMTESNFGSGYDPPYQIVPKFRVGLSYVPIRVKSGGQFYYGWLEFFSSDYNDSDPDDFVLVSRFGVAQTPGLRIRMGQE